MDVVPASSSEEDHQNNNLIQFLTLLRSLNLLAQKNVNSTIVYADDSFVNREAMRINLEDMEIAINLIMFQDGLETINYFNELLEDL